MGKRDRREKIVKVIPRELTGLSYHSGALAFSFMLSIIPITVFFGTLLRFLPLRSFDGIVSEVSQLFPDVTRGVLTQILKGTSSSFSVLSLIIALIFTSNFIGNLERALTLVTKGYDDKESLISKTVSNVRLGKFKLSYISHIISTLLLALAFAMSLITVLIVDIYSAKVLGYLSPNLKRLLIQFLVLTLNLVAIYRFLLPKRVKLSLLLKVSMLLSVLLVLLKYAFTFYAHYWLKHVPIYGGIAYVFLLLIWLNLMFYLMLLGGRVLIGGRSS